MMREYPTIDGVEPNLIRGLRVPREEGEEFPGVTEADTHQQRAIYEFEELTVAVFPVFEEGNDGVWTPVWKVEVTDDVNGGRNAYGPFEDPSAAISRVRAALGRIE